jgi:hypothetical protein
MGFSSTPGDSLFSFFTGCAPGLSAGIGGIGFWSDTGGIGGETVRFGMR